MPKHQGPARAGFVRGVGAVVIFFISGCISLGVGISNVQHSGELRAHGVTVQTTVTATSGWGRYAVRVRYMTRTGQPEQGTLDVASPSDLKVGSVVTAVYDPDSPSTVTLPGSGSGNGWAEVVIGAVFMAVTSVAGGTYLVSRLRHRHQPAA